jgi:hypothetical protein
MTNGWAQRSVAPPDLSLGPRTIAGPSLTMNSNRNALWELNERPAETQGGITGSELVGFKQAIPVWRTEMTVI